MLVKEKTISYSFDQLFLKGNLLGSDCARARKKLCAVHDAQCNTADLNSLFLNDFSAF